MSDNEGWQTVPVKSARPTLKHGNTVHVIHELPNSSIPVKHRPLARNPHSQRGSELRKVADADGGKPKMLTVNSRSAMSAARVAFGLTQKELDARGSFPTNSCNSWESGRQCPNSIQIQVIHRILGVKLERM